VLFSSTSADHWHTAAVCLCRRKTPGLDALAQLRQARGKAGTIGELGGALRGPVAMADSSPEVRHYLEGARAKGTIFWWATSLRLLATTLAFAGKLSNVVNRQHRLADAAIGASRH